MNKWILAAAVVVSANLFSGDVLVGQLRIYLPNGDFVGEVDTRGMKHRVVRVGQGTTPEALGYDVETLRYPYSAVRCDVCFERLSENEFVVGEVARVNLGKRGTGIKIIESDVGFTVPASEYSFLIYANADRLMRYKLTGHSFDKRTNYYLKVKVVSFDSESGEYGFEVFPTLQCGNRVGFASVPEVWYFDGEFFTMKVRQQVGVF